MRCEDVRPQLPDRALGGLPEAEDAAVRRHLRGCAVCRTEADALDRGVATFASAAHAAPAPPELRARVLGVLAREWEEAGASPARRSRRAEAGAEGAALTPIASRRRAAVWLAAAAALALLAGSLAWGAAGRSELAAAERTLAAARPDAAAYRALLGALDGRDVRVAALLPQGGALMSGTAVLYDSRSGESWVLVLCRGYPSGSTEAFVTLRSASGRAIRLPAPMRFDAAGNGSAWLVTSADLTGFDRVTVTAPGGRALVAGTVRAA